MKFNFKEPPDVERHRAYEGETLAEANDEIRELRRWLYALTEQLEYVIGKEEERGNK